MAIDWTRGYTSEWRAYLVDPRTWADSGRAVGVTSLAVERTCDGDAPLLESASLSVDAAPGEGFARGWWRVAMHATQGGETERVDVCTVYVESGGGTVERGVDSLDVTGRSVLYPASRRRLALGSYAPSGADGAAWAASLLSDSGVCAPIVVEGGFRLDDQVTFDGCTALKAAWLVLRAGGFCLRIAGDGTVYVGPEPTEPALELDRARARLLHDGLSHDLDLSDVPNRYEATNGTEVAVALNDDPASETSTVRRGYVHDAARDDSPTRVNGETLQAYAERRLEEESTVYDVRQYEREWWPGVRPGDVVRCSLGEFGLDGDLRVVRQSLACGLGIVVTEEARKEVATWRRR